jgi:hypothetical protein
VRYVATVSRVLRKVTHTLGAIVDGEVKTVETMPLPERIEIGWTARKLNRA